MTSFIVNWSCIICSFGCNIKYLLDIASKQHFIKSHMIYVCFSVLLAMLLLFCLRRRKPDTLFLLEPDQDIRETIGEYDEEGAGDYMNLIHLYSLLFNLSNKNCYL